MRSKERLKGQWSEYEQIWIGPFVCHIQRMHDGGNYLAYVTWSRYHGLFRDDLGKHVDINGRCESQEEAKRWCVDTVRRIAQIVNSLCTDALEMVGE